MCLPLPFLLLLITTAILRAGERPNIAFVLCHGLGTRNVRCFNPQSKIPQTNTVNVQLCMAAVARKKPGKKDDRALAK